MTKPFTTPFAENGDVMFIPEGAQSDGSVSYETGFGPDYSADPLEANAKPVPRAGHNELFNQITGSIGDIQRQGAADWYLEFAADGGYPKNAIVWLDGDRWKSQIDGNTTRPNIDEIAWLPSAKFEGGGGGGGGDFGLTGPTTIAVGGSFQYKISPYSSFMTYAVSATNGTATISGDTITLAIVPEETANVTDLTVVRSDGARNDFRIAIGAQSIAKPSMLSPASESVDVPLGPLLTASAFMTYPDGADTHLNTDWRIRTMAGAVVWQSLANAVNKTNIQVPDNTLPLNTQLQADVRYRGATLPVSAWSDAVTFTTTNQSISTPTITAPLNGATGIGATPTFTATAFATNPLGADTHASSDWQLKNSLGVVIWSSVADVVNKTSITLPTGVLAVSSQYTMEVRYNGNVLQPSQWSPVVSFTTAAAFEFGKYLLMSGGNTHIFGQDIDTFVPIVSLSAGTSPTRCAFAPDGAHFAIGQGASPFIALYLRTGDTTARLAPPAVLPPSIVWALCYSPDSTKLIVCHNTAPYLSLYTRSGNTYTYVSSPSLSVAGVPSRACFSPDGANLYVSHAKSPYLSFFSVSGNTFTRQSNPAALPPGDATSVACSPDGVHVGVVSSVGASKLSFYKRSGNALVRLPTNSYTSPTGTSVSDISFSGAGGRVSVASEGNKILNYSIAGDTFLDMPAVVDLPAGVCYACAYSRDGQHFATVSGGSPSLTMHKVSGTNYTRLSMPVYPNPRAITAGLSFYPPVLGR